MQITLLKLILYATENANKIKKTTVSFSGKTLLKLKKCPPPLKKKKKKNKIKTGKCGEFISPAEVDLVCLKFFLSFIKFCLLVTELWLICGF